MRQKRPNFILFIADQMRADHVACYGNPTVKTAAIDALAARGMRFSRFYVNCPICMPNRAAMMTSRMPTLCRVRHNGIPLDRDAVTFVDLLRAAGYATALIGKSHLQNINGSQVDPYIFERRLVGDLPPEELSDASRRRLTGPDYEIELNPRWIAGTNREVPSPYYGFDFVRFANGHSDRVQGHYADWLKERHPDPASLRGPANALPSNAIAAPQTWRTAMPEHLYPTSYVEETSIDYLAERAAAADGAPFFLQCSFPDPHHPFAPPGRYFDMYDPAQIPLPESFAYIERHETALAARLRREHAEGNAKNLAAMPFACGPEAVRQCIALTYGMITMIDGAIERIVHRLSSLGLADDTVLIFTSDHGDFMGDHGLMLKMGLHYQGVIRVPFIWSDPRDHGPRSTDLLGSTIDIGPSVLARAGLAPNNGVQGFDVIGAARDGTSLPRRGILIEEDELGGHLGSAQGLRTRTLVTDQWRLSLWEGMPDGELFDLKNDPHELNNLWFDPAHAAMRAEMMEAMLRETIRLTDTAPLAAHLA